MPKLSINFEEIILRAHGCFEEQNKVLASSIIIINYCIIININAQCNYYTRNKASSRNTIRTKCGSNCGCCCLLFQKKTVKRSVQCHVLVQSPPGRRPNDKYPLNTWHRSDLCSNVSLQCYLVATVIHIQSLRSQISVYIYEG